MYIIKIEIILYRDERVSRALTTKKKENERPNDLVTVSAISRPRRLAFPQRMVTPSSPNRTVGSRIA